ncbi:MAG: alpha/beta hydrolase [Pseudomonadota bacterium]
MEWRTGERLWLDIGADRLEGRCWGPSPDAARTIVMLHEGLGCVDLWRDFPEAVAEATGCGVFAYSRAGYGRSSQCDLPRSQNYMTCEAKAVLPEILDAIGVRKGVLLGHSDGATIAAEYLGLFQDHRIRGLILMAPHFFAEQESHDAIAAAQTAFLETDMSAKMARYHDHPEIAFRGWAEAWLRPDFKEWNVSDCIDYWRVPCLAIQGFDDQYGTPAQIEEITSRAYSPVDAVLLEDCRHAPHFEQRDRTLAEVTEFMERLERIEPA